jgi:RNA polymerase sigma-70 factor, ECF subfamily
VEVQRSVIAAFVAAARDGDFQRLVAVLDPEVVIRTDVGAPAGGSIETRGAEQVARGALSFSRLGVIRLPVLVNGAAGLVAMLEGKLFAVMAFTVRGGKITQVDILRDPERLSQLDLTVLDG